MKEKKIDLLKQLAEDIEGALNNYLRKAGINGRAYLSIKEDINYPRRYFTKEEIVDVVNEMCQAKYGTLIQDKVNAHAVLYRKIFFKIFHDNGYRYKQLEDIIIVDQSTYIHSIKNLEDFLAAKEGPIVEAYEAVLNRLYDKYQITYEETNDNIS